MKDAGPNILLLKPSSLGDIVHALPVAAALRQSFPSASLTWLIKRQWAEVLEGNPHLDRVLAVDFSVAGWPAIIHAVRDSHFNVVLDLQGLLRSAVLAWISRAPVRVGFDNAREGSRWFYTHRVPVDNGTIHAVDRYLLLARAVTAVLGQTPPLKFPMPSDTTTEGRISSLLRAEDVLPDAPLVALNPGARWPTKQWPSALFAEVGDRLQESGFRVVLLGDGTQSDPADAVLNSMRSRPINLVGRTTIKDLIELLRRVRLLVTNDSGPMHLAAAVGVPIIALFGPTDPVRTGPYGTGHMIFTSPVACRPCLSRRCLNPNHLECLTSISAAQVIRHALSILQDTKRNTGLKSHEDIMLVGDSLSPSPVKGKG
jgi:heptosyltransferase-1